MHVMLLNQYFHPDVAATAQLASDLGEELVRRGHQVTAVASTGSYVGGARLERRGEHKGMRFVRVGATAFGRRSKFLRAVDYATFLAGALVPVIAAERPDVLVALSTPPLVAVLGLLAKSLRRTRLVYWVMDVYPELAIRLGVLARGGLPARALERLGRRVFERADAVIALDESMRDRLIAGGAAPHKVEVIDNWCDGDAIRPRPPEENALRSSLGIGDTFTVSYSGNMGACHDLRTIARAMAILRDDAIHWLFVGDGPRRAELESSVRALAISRATFLPYQERERLSVSLTAAQASIVSLAPDVAGLVVPSKLYGILASGTPVVYIGPRDGRAAGVVRDHGVGVAVENGDADGLARALRRLRDDPVERARMGERARSIFDARFSRWRALERHHQVLARVAAA